jgi:hypothetical protein
VAIETERRSEVPSATRRGMNGANDRHRKRGQRYYAAPGRRPRYWPPLAKVANDAVIVGARRPENDRPPQRFHSRRNPAVPARCSAILNDGSGACRDLHAPDMGVREKLGYRYKPQFGSHGVLRVTRLDSKLCHFSESDLTPWRPWVHQRGGRRGEGGRVFRRAVAPESRRAGKALDLLARNAGSISISIGSARWRRCPCRRDVAIDHQPVALSPTLDALAPVENSGGVAMLARSRKLVRHRVPLICRDSFPQVRRRREGGMFRIGTSEVPHTENWASSTDPKTS